MEIGTIIREHRKKKNITQEEMANRLGVTTPAVNKWEKGVSQPDIMLLAPIARLLDITLDTLLSFEKDLTKEEINSITQEVSNMLKTKVYEEAFQFAKSKIEKYPNCLQLIWQLTVILDVGRLTNEISNPEEYDTCIKEYYERVLESPDELIRKGAANSLFEFYLRKEQYDKAESYLDYFSMENPEKKRKQAIIYSKTNRVGEAYKEYEELLFSEYQTISLVLRSLYMLAVEEKDMEKAHILAKKQSDLSKLFEMGEYNEVSCMHELAIIEKDIDATLSTMEIMLHSVHTIADFTKSSLYDHMKFKEIKDEVFTQVRENLLDCLREDETYHYMKKDERWKALMKKQFA